MLTEKEIEVLKLRKKGLTQADIAAKLDISQPAVSSFEKSIARKIRNSLDVIELLKEMGIDSSKYRGKK